MRGLDLFSVVSVAAASAVGDICWTTTFNSRYGQTCRVLQSSAAVQDVNGEEVRTRAVELAWRKSRQCAGEYCAFTNPALGGGSVAVTSSVNVPTIADFPSNDNFPAESPPFYETPIQGKGSGLVANRTIRKGEIIMIRPAYMLVQEGAHRHLDTETRASLYEMAQAELPAERGEQVMLQVGDTIADKVDRNAFQMVIRDNDNAASHLACFHQVGKMNHDCRPNVQYRIKGLTHTTVAVRDIRPGEELTISYIDSTLLREERQKLLQTWGFNCTCAACSADKDAARRSDARLLRIAELKDELENVTSTAVTPETGAELVALHREERLDLYISKAYTRAALNFALFAKEAEAKEYAALAVEALKREWGPLSGDIPGMERLASDPKSHWAWGKRLRRASRRP